MRTLIHVVAVALLAAAGCGPRAASAPAPVTSTPPAKVVQVAPAPPAPPSTAPSREAIVAAPEARSAKGMVVSQEELATRVGVDVLREGGTAVDAIVATAFALAVTLPAAGNVGGGGFAVLRTAAGQRAALDFRETAPAAASRDMYLTKDGAVSEDATTGHRASGVPGSVAGLAALHKAHGKLPWARLLAPAIALARDGFAVSPQLAAGLARDAERLARFPATRALYLPGGQPLAAGTILKNPALARVLERIAKQGEAGFYRGDTAKLIVGEMRRGKGLITAKDLEGYRAIWRTPLVFRYRGHEIIAMPQPSSGGMVLWMIATLLEPFDLPAWPWHDARQVHVTVEAFRRAYALRNTLLSDPAFLTVVDAEVVAQAGRTPIDPARATPSREVAGGAEIVEPEHTTHLAAVDEAGMVVALTTTINGPHGNAVVVTGAGFFLNNEMDDFTAKPGTPNSYGLMQNEANAIAPGKRMLSSMAPTIVLAADGSPLLVVGAQGGSRITTAVWQVISNVVDDGMTVGQAVAAPRFHHQHLPDELVVEDGALTPEGRAALAAMGHAVVDAKWPIASTTAILYDGGVWTGAVDPRRGGLALGP